MLTYRDRTFCNNKNCIKECNRKLTDKILKEAAECGMYVAVAVFDCSTNEVNNENKTI